MVRHRDVVTTQTKTRERVRDLAEVFTHEREVNAMLDLVPDMFPSEAAPRNIDRTFLEPACGAGNFLVAILERKLAYVTFGTEYRSLETFETAVLRGLSSIYGIDIDTENVEQSRNFLRVEVEHHVDTRLNGQPVTDDFYAAVDAILTTNVLRADTLKDAQQIEVVKYRWERKTGYVLREWTFLDEQHGAQGDLFVEVADGPKADAVAIHYSKLAKNHEPTSVLAARREQV